MTLNYRYTETTKSFHLYRFDNGAVDSNLYIRHWRVPEPIPRSIELNVNHTGSFDQPNNGSIRYYEDNIDNRLEKIVWNVDLHTEHESKARYGSGRKSNRPFNTIYIPYSLCMVGDEDDVAKRLQVTIEWS